MDKRTLSQYGWSVITIIVLTIMLGLATPFGNYIATSLRAVTFSLSDVQKEQINKYTTEGYALPTDYLASEIDQIPTLYGIGRNDQTFVVANFNDDYTECVITKNGINSDGAMMSFDNSSELFISPLFEHRSTLKKVIVDYGVLNIGPGLFESCNALTDIVLHSSVADFGNENMDLDSWANALNANTLSWETTNKSITVYYDGQVDYTPIKSLIRKVIVLDGTKAIGDSEFFGWNKTKEIVLPESLTKIGNSAFHDCKKLTQINIPNSVKQLGTKSFQGCSSIVSIQFSTGVEVIPEGCFWGCTSLTHIDIPSNVKRLEKHSFYTCLGLKNVMLSNSIEYIGDYAFAQCRLLEKIVLPDNLTTLGSYAFMGDKKLTSITLPDKLESTGYGILEDCLLLKDVYISSNLKRVESRTFNNDESLEYVIIPDSVTYMTQCFCNCTSLKSIYIPSSVVTIGPSTFLNCPDTLIIQCKQGSSAESWATSNGYRVMYDTHYNILRIINNAYNSTYGYSKITKATIVASAGITTTLLDTYINNLIDFGYITVASTNDGYSVTDAGKETLDAFIPVYGLNH